MAKNPSNVFNFLSSLRAKLTPPAQIELQRLLALKKAHLESRNEPFDSKFYTWDFHYYNNLLLEKEYDIDAQVIREYFEVGNVVSGVLKIYQNMLGVEFKELSPTDENGSRWHEDVRVFEVREAVPGPNRGEFLGTFYLDLYPRDGKYVYVPKKKRWIFF